MAKIGSYEFPEVSISASVELAHRIQLDLGGEVSRNNLAHMLGMSPAGGAFATRIGALRIWGLASGRSILRLTADGELAASGNDIDALRRIARSVPIFNLLHDRLGSNAIDPGILIVILQDITGADIADIRARIRRIERIFAESRRYMPPEEQSMEGPTAFHNAPSFQDADSQPMPTNETREGWMQLKFDDGSLSLAETPENIDVMIGMLAARKRRLLDR